MAPVRSLLIPLVTLCAAWLTACANVTRPPAGPPPSPPLADALFAPPAEAQDAAGLFTLSPEMKQFMQRRLATPDARHDLQRALVNALYRRDELQLAYDDSLTRTPAQAFAQRRGNCLSLVLMTAAFAKALGLPVDYQQVDVDEQLDRSGDLLLRAGHVNLVLNPPLQTQTRTYGSRYSLTIDFLPPSGPQRPAGRSLSEATVLALFHNNRAAEALIDGDANAAYWQARAALQQDPALLAAVNTLGVVYQRAGQPALAALAFEQVLARAPDDLSALANQVTVLHRLGRHGEAEAHARRLAALEPEPPFAALDAGRQALQRGDADAALVLFDREARRHPDAAEVHAWRAQALHRLGRFDAASQALNRALALSARPDERQRFGAKLAWLKAQQAAH